MIAILPPPPSAHVASVPWTGYGSYAFVPLRQMLDKWSQSTRNTRPHNGRDRTNRSDVHASGVVTWGWRGNRGERLVRQRRLLLMDSGRHCVEQLELPHT